MKLRHRAISAFLTCILVGSAAAWATEYPQSDSPHAVNLRGLVAEYCGPAPDELVDDLVQTAIDRDTQTDRLKKKSKEHNGIVQKTINHGRLVAQVMTQYRGFELSSEGADVILDEKISLKSAPAVDYARQKQADDYHTKIYASLIQIAQGLGSNDQQRRGQAIESAMKALRELVGQEEAEKTLASMTAWAEQVHVPEGVFKQRSWDLMEIQAKADSVCRAALADDPVVSGIRRSLHRYNSHSKLGLASAKVINTSLCVAMLSPTIVSPAAQLAQLLYLEATGGSEDTKLVKELYLDKRMESRWKRYNQEAGQAVNAYSSAVLSKNPILLAFTEAMISKLAGEDFAGQIIGADLLVARKSTRDNEISCPQTHSEKR